MDLGLKNKKAIVTGSTKGIGRRIVNLLADEGADIAVCARNADEVGEAIEALSASGATVVGRACDVRKKEEYEAWIEDMVGELGGVDIFIPNVSAGGGMESEQNWIDNFEVDVLGTVRGCEVVIPHMQKGGGGAITIIATTAAVETFMAPMAYNAMKAGLLTYTKQLGQHVGGDGIRVNAVSPGPIFFEGGAWEAIKGAMEEVYNAAVAEHPTARMGSPEEIASCVVFLSSPAASWVNGSNLIVDGGYTKRVQF